jgi:hypothetical protein
VCAPHTSQRRSKYVRDDRADVPGEWGLQVLHAFEQHHPDREGKSIPAMLAWRRALNNLAARAKGVT